jgi:uncharacterized protein YecT (DUF1311 family)
MNNACKKIGTIAGGLVILLSATVASATPSYERFRLTDAVDEGMTSPEYDRCLEASEGITINMRDCASAEQDRLDIRLNAAYRTAMARLPNQAARNRLRDLERRWLATRWNECHREADEETGTMGLLMLDGCELSEMERRIVWLERYGG